MEIIVTLLPFFFCFFFLAQIAAKPCNVSQCTAGGEPIRFPFRLIDQQPPSCGYSTDFDLSCNELKQTIFTLPSSGDFIVESISYTSQVMWINDRNNCIFKRFLNKTFTLLGSPFRFSHELQEYTFYKCPPQIVRLWSPSPISCLSNGNYEVVGVTGRPTSTSFSGFCDVITTAMVPAESYYELTNPDGGVRLTWNVPDCRSCEASTDVCGFQNGSRSEIHCFSISSYGLSKAAKYGIAVGVLIPGLLSITCCALYVSSRRGELPERNRGRLQQSTTELSGTVIDSLTIESSFPKTQLGDSLELPNPNDKTCSICLGEYQPKETLRTIPECNHYFHSNCIDEWLGKNPTCPLCRNLPVLCRNPPEVSLVRPHDDYAIY